MTETSGLYELYAAFESRFCEYASSTCVTASAREHYRRTLRPMSADEFWADLARLPKRAVHAKARVWKKGFDLWLRTQTRRMDAQESRWAEFGYPEGVIRVVQELADAYHRLPPLPAAKEVAEPKPALPREF